MVDRSASLPQLERAIFFDSEEWDEIASGGAPPDESERPASGSISTSRSTSSTRAARPVPEGRDAQHHNILNNGHFLAAARLHRARPRLRPGAALPLLRDGDRNLACTSSGACIVYPAESFDPEATLRACAEERCTSLYGVPTMFIAELGNPSFAGYDLSSLRTGIMAVRRARSR